MTYNLYRIDWFQKTVRTKGTGTSFVVAEDFSAVQKLAVTTYVMPVNAIVSSIRVEQFGVRDNVLDKTGDDL